MPGLRGDSKSVLPLCFYVLEGVLCREIVVGVVEKLVVFAAADVDDGRVSGGRGWSWSSSTRTVGIRGIENYRAYHVTASLLFVGVLSSISRF